MVRKKYGGTGLRAGVLALALGGLVACGTGAREQVGAVLGGAAGGVAGAQIGQGTGQLAATGVGAGLGTLAGAAAGRSLDAAAARDERRQSVIRRTPRLLADPTRQVPIPGAAMPGGFWSWLPDFGPPAPMRNVQQVSTPGESAACQPLDGPRLKPTFRCTQDGISYVIQ